MIIVTAKADRISLPLCSLIEDKIEAKVIGSVKMADGEVCLIEEINKHSNYTFSNSINRERNCQKTHTETTLLTRKINCTSSHNNLYRIENGIERIQRSLHQDK